MWWYSHQIWKLIIKKNSEETDKARKRVTGSGKSWGGPAGWSGLHHTERSANNERKRAAPPPPHPSPSPLPPLHPSPPPIPSIPAAHRVGRVISFFSSRRNRDSRNPSPTGECASPPPPGSGGGAHSLGERGVGRVPIPTRGQTLWYSFFIRTLCRSPNTDPIK